MRIGQRLAAGFGSLVLAVLVGAAVTVGGLKTLSDLTETLYRHPFTVSNASVQAQFDIARIRNEMLQLVLFEGQDDMDESVAEIEALSRNVDDNLRLIRERFLGDVKRVELAQGHMANWALIRRAIIDALKAGDRAAAARLAQNEGTPTFDSAMREMDYVRDFSRRKATEVFEETIHHTDQFSIIAFSVFAASLALATAISWAVTRSIVQPLSQLNQAKRRLAAGELDVAVPALDRSDELGEMARDLNVLKQFMIERERAQEQSRLLSEALEQSSNLVLMTDAQGTIIYVNRTFTKITGFTAEEVIGRNPRLLKSDNTPQSAHAELWRTIGAGAEWRGELEDRRKDGSPFWVLATISPIRGEAGEVTHFIATHEDITDRKLAEIQLQQAYDRAEVASRAKTELLANMSHELRTPLNAIIGFAEVIDSEALGANHPRYREYVRDILASGRHLLALINDILDVSAIEAGKLMLREEEVAVPDLVHSCLRLIQPKAMETKVEVSVAIQPEFTSVRADERRLRQILLNLLSNAVKFTPEGGAVTLRAFLGADGSGSFEVRDTGIGMDAAGLRKALSPFGQVDTAYTRRHQGSGLGLPLAVSLVEAHGGTLVIDTAPGQGTAVTVTFPPERCLHQVVA
ncbi:MAG: PAS domain S-box protein [Solirubrobacterales bacterium]